MVRLAPFVVPQVPHGSSESDCMPSAVLLQQAIGKKTSLRLKTPQSVNMPAPSRALSLIEDYEILQRLNTDFMDISHVTEDTSSHVGWQVDLQTQSWKHNIKACILKCSSVSTTSLQTPAAWRTGPK